MEKRLLYIAFAIFLSAAGCTTEIDIKPVGEKEKLVVLGEISASDSVIVHLSMAKNVSQEAVPVPSLTNAQVQLFDTQNNLVTTLQHRQNNKWSSPFITAAQQTYHFKATVNGKTAEITTTIPRAFSAIITKQESYSGLITEVTIQINNENKSAAYYVIEYLQAKNNGGLKLQSIESSDPKTDNYIYNELSKPYDRLFVRTDNSKKTVTLRILKPNLDEKYVLRIKSVDPDYYRYLYNYEVQKDNYSLMELSPSDQSYLGILGGVYKIDFSIK